MALNSLTAVQIKSIIETEKHITQLLNYSATHPDAVTQYRRSGMILHVYLYASYISEPDARSRADGYLLLRPKSNTLIKAIPPENGPVHVECSIMINFMESDTES